MKETTWELYEKCVPFHGHSCGGLAIGVRVAAEAIEILKLKPWGTQRTDEEVVCVSENDACGVDAIQVILGCTPGKGSMKFEITGKMAFNIYNRENGESLRFCLKNFLKEDAIAYFKGKGIDIEEAKAKMAFILEAPIDMVFSQTKVRFPLPEKAPSYPSIICERCGESTAAPYITERQAEKLCKTCSKERHEI